VRPRRICRIFGSWPIDLIAVYLIGHDHDIVDCESNDSDISQPYLRTALRITSTTQLQLSTAVLYYWSNKLPSQLSFQFQLRQISSSIY